jgi:hypothetical protein
MPVSQNGWPANDPSRIRAWLIPGTSRRVSLEAGAGGALLVHFAAWFHRNIEPIDVGQLDDWGYAVRPIRGGRELSNHASGTGLDLNAPKHFLGASGTFTGSQAAAIRAQLRRYGGAIRWGGDYTGRKDEMHFEINCSPGKAREVAAGLGAITGGVLPAPPVRRRLGEDDVMRLDTPVDGKGYGRAAVSVEAGNGSLPYAGAYLCVGSTWGATRFTVTSLAGGRVLRQDRIEARNNGNYSVQLPTGARLVTVEYQAEGPGVLPSAAVFHH